MRQFSTNVDDVINSNNIRFFYLIDLYFTEDYHFTSYSSDITYDGNTYTSDGGLFEIDNPKLSSIIDREAYRVVIADFNDQFLEEMRNNIVGKSILVRLGFIDLQTDTPMLNPNDILNVYKGYVDTPEIINTWDSKLASIEGTSPMADLDMINSFLSSRDSMHQRNANDSSFDEIYDSSELDLKWGKV
jgi:hypothetical protein